MDTETITAALPAAPVSRSERTRQLAEVAVVYALVEAALWTLGWKQLVWSLAATITVAVLTLRSRRSVHELGIAGAGLRQALWIIPAAIIMGGVCVLMAWQAGTLHLLHDPNRPLWHALLYAAGALAQQFLLQSFIFVRLEVSLGTRWAVAGAALLFALAHIPNAVLVPATLVFALIFTCAFARYRNIYPLAIAHALLGLALAVSLPDTFTHFMRVGAAMIAAG